MPSSSRRSPVRHVTALRLSAMLLAGLAIQAAPAAAQAPPPDFDGTSATFYISANSMLRYGDSLLSKHYMTVGAEGMQIKGRGRCTVFVCPVAFNGIDLFARRSRLRVDGPGNPQAPGYASKPGDTYIRPGTPGYIGTGKRCEGITRTLRRGDDSTEVRVLQDILVKMGFNEVTADGRYGRKTQAAVEQFQRRVNIKADGTVGPKTVEFLKC